VGIEAFRAELAVTLISWSMSVSAWLAFASRVTPCVPLRSICKELCRQPYRLNVGRGKRRLLDTCLDGRTCRAHAWCLNRI